MPRICHAVRNTIFHISRQNTPPITRYMTKAFIAFVMAATALLAGCKPLQQLMSPPAFASVPYWYAVDNGNDVPFSVYISFPTSEITEVSCANDSIVLQEASSEWVMSGTFDPLRVKQPALSVKWSGIAPYASLPDKGGKNEITCKATNTYGTVEKVAAIIEYIPNVAPQLVLASTDFLLCGNNGNKSFDITLLDASSTYIRGAEYILNGTLDSGLKVNYWLGKLSGIPTSGNRQWNNLKLRVVTVAGEATTAPFSVTVTDAACP